MTLMRTQCPPPLLPLPSSPPGRPLSLSPSLYYPAHYSSTFPFYPLYSHSLLLLSLSLVMSTLIPLLSSAPFLFYALPLNSQTTFPSCTYICAVYTLLDIICYILYTPSSCVYIYICVIQIIYSRYAFVIHLCT